MNYYVQCQQRGNRIAYVIRDSERGIEVAWATSGEDAKQYIADNLHGQDITDWEYHRVLGSIPKE
jgi:hypothetical protein